MPIALLWVAICGAVGVALWSSYQHGRREAVQEVLAEFDLSSPSSVNMAVPADLFERIDKIGGIKRPKVRIKENRDE